jgi:hypothetical protein
MAGKWWQRLFPKYGNWGAPGWSGGGYTVSQMDPDVLAVEPVDSMDLNFKLHDIGYQTAIKAFEENQIDYRSMLHATAVADEKLIERLLDMCPDPRKWKRPTHCCHLYARLYRYGAIGGFWVKVKLQRIIFG